MYDSKPENNIKKHSTFQDFLVINRGNKSVHNQNEQALEVCPFPQVHTAPINVMGITGKCKEKKNIFCIAPTPGD